MSVLQSKPARRERPKPSPVVEYYSRAESFSGLAELAQALGRPLEPMLRRHGFSSELLSDPEARISYRALCQLLETCAAEWNCPDFGLRLAKIQNLHIFGPVGLVVRLTDTVAGGFKALKGSMAVHSTGYTIDLDEGDVAKRLPAALIFSPKANSGAKRQMNELALGISRNVLAMISGLPSPRLIRVCFQHAKPDDCGPAQRYFGCPIYYGEADNALYFAPELSKMPTAIYDPAYAALIQAYFKQIRPQIELDIVDSTRQLIAKLLSTGRCTRELVAEGLNLHPRTFQRQLQDKGVTFAQLLDEYRHTVALDLLERETLPLAEVALVLGYASQSSFNQAFRRWTESTPTNFRRAHG